MKQTEAIRGLKSALTAKSFSGIALLIVFVLTAHNLTAATAAELDGDASPRLLGLAHELLPWGFRAMMEWIKQNPPRFDPLTPRQYAGSSYVELPDAPPQPWINKQAGVPSGRNTKEKFKSQILKAEYFLSLYTPPGYEQNGPRCWLMIAFDGGSTTRDITLDNLLAARKIPPLVVVGIKNI